MFLTIDQLGIWEVFDSATKPRGHKNCTGS